MVAYSRTTGHDAAHPCVNYSVLASSTGRVSHQYIIHLGTAVIAVAGDGRTVDLAALQLHVNVVEFVV